MDWKNGFTAKYYCTVVDPITWQDVSRFEIVGGRINRTDDGLMGSADIDCVNRKQAKEQWVRIYLEAVQNSGSERVALFTGLATSPDRKIDGSIENNPLACYSVLKACDDILLERGWFAPKGMVGTDLIKSLLKRSTPAPVEIDADSAPLTKYIIAEDGETYLSMVEKILKAINFRLRIDGMGTIHIAEQAKFSSGMFDPYENDIVLPEIDVSDDWYDCPNVLRTIVDDSSIVIKDESDSDLSISGRGREIWVQETNCNLSDAESQATYTARRLKELQSHSVEVSYKRRYQPGIFVGDIVTLNYPKQGLQGDFKVFSQTIEIGYGAETSEKVKKI